MPTKRFIFRYVPKGPAPIPTAEEAIVAGGMKIVDSSSRMLLAEGDQTKGELLQSVLPDWSISEERTYSKPQPVVPVLKSKASSRK